MIITILGETILELLLTLDIFDKTEGCFSGKFNYFNKKRHVNFWNKNFDNEEVTQEAGGENLKRNHDAWRASKSYKKFTPKMIEELNLDFYRYALKFKQC